MLNIQTNISTGAHVRVLMPEPSQVTVPAVRAALEKTLESFAEVETARRELHAADQAVDRAKLAVTDQAAAELMKAGKVPKGLRTQIADAKEVLEDSRLVLHATESRLDNDFRMLKAVIEANAPALRVAALKDGERALNLLTAARKSVETADREALAAFGILGMLATGEQQGHFAPVIGTTPQQFYVAEALDKLGPAIGDTALKLDEYRRG